MGRIMSDPRVMLERVDPKWSQISQDDWSTCAFVFPFPFPFVILYFGTCIIVPPISICLDSELSRKGKMEIADAIGLSLQFFFLNVRVN
jgi:hypothetical protein